MDPTQTLAEIRDLIEQGELDDALVERVTGLDQWMTRGGFPPEQWKPRTPMGRPRREVDGVVLEGVEHGKRRSYNKGCRCIPCTAANRDAATARRITAQMEEENDA